MESNLVECERYLSEIIENESGNFNDKNNLFYHQSLAICHLLIGKTKEAIILMEKTANYLDENKNSQNEIFIYKYNLTRMY